MLFITITVMKGKRLLGISRVPSSLRGLFHSATFSLMSLALYTFHLAFFLLPPAAPAAQLDAEIVGVMPTSVFISSSQEFVVGQQLTVTRAGQPIATLQVTKVNKNAAQGTANWIIEAKILGKTAPINTMDQVVVGSSSTKTATDSTDKQVGVKDSGPPMKINAEDISQLSESINNILAELALIKKMLQEGTEKKGFASASDPLGIPSTDSITPGDVEHDNSGKPRIAVVSFTAPGMGYSKEKIEQNLIRHIEAEIGRTGRFAVVSRSQLDAVLEEQRLALSGFIDPSTAVKVGKIVGAKGLVYGQITRADVETRTSDEGKVYKTAKVGLSASIVDAETGELLASEIVEGADYDGNVPDAFLDAAKELGRRIATAFPITTRLARGGSDRVTVVGGQDIGLMVGWHFDVFRGSQPITDPVSGEVLDMNRNKVGQVRITSVGPRTSEAIVVAGKNLQPGDVLISTRSVSGFDPNMKFYLALGVQQFKATGLLADRSFEPAFGALLDYNLAKGRRVFVKPTATLQVDYVPMTVPGEGFTCDLAIIPIRASWGLAFGGLTPRLYAGAGLTYAQAKLKDCPFERTGENKDKAFGYHLGGRFYFSEKLYVSAILTLAKSDVMDYGGLTFTAAYKFR